MRIFRMGTDEPILRARNASITTSRDKHPTACSNRQIKWIDLSACAELLSSIDPPSLETVANPETVFCQVDDIMRMCR